MGVWLGLGFGCGGVPWPWVCHPPPLPGPGCHEGKPAECWGDAGGLDGEPMGGMKGLGPVGVVGLLENPGPAQENKNFTLRGAEETINKCMCLCGKLTSKAPPEVADVCKWVQCVWLD